HRVFCLIHVGIDTDRRDFHSVGVEGQGHPVSRLRIVNENQIHGAGNGIQRDAPSLFGLFHFLGIGGQVHSQKLFHFSHVFLNFLFFSLNHSLFEPATARLFRRRTNGGLLNRAVGTVLATVLCRRFRVTLQSQLGRFD